MKGKLVEMPPKPSNLDSVLNPNYRFSLSYFRPIKSINLNHLTKHHVSNLYRIVNLMLILYPEVCEMNCQSLHFSDLLITFISSNRDGAARIDYTCQPK